MNTAQFSVSVLPFSPALAENYRSNALLLYRLRMRMLRTVLVSIPMVACAASPEPIAEETDIEVAQEPKDESEPSTLWVRENAYFQDLLKVPSEPPKPGDVAAQALAKLSACTEISTGRYKTDVSASAVNLPVCGTNGAVHFAADMDIDCDGKVTSVCNSTTDKSFQPQTAGVDSFGKPLDSSVVPYVVVPGVSTRFDYRARGIKMGSLAAVFYRGKVVYGVVGDVGPTAILGEASYAMARELGINPNPSTGGAASGVTYLIFTGPQNTVTKLEDIAGAKAKAEAALRTWLAAN
jgi:hypothetical protein